MPGSLFFLYVHIVGLDCSNTAAGADAIISLVPRRSHQTKVDYHICYVKAER